MPSAPKGYVTLWAMRGGQYVPVAQNPPPMHKLRAWQMAGRIDLREVREDARTTLICAKNIEKDGR